MNSNFSKQELKERLLDLLYGLADDDAEELRRLVASDADAARCFDEARETVALLSRAARVELEENAPIEETSRNVAVDRGAFDVVSPFAFDAAVGAFGEGVFQGALADDAAAENGGENDRASVAKTKEKTRPRREKSAKKAKRAAPKALDANAGGDGGGDEKAGDWATVGRTSSAAPSGSRRRSFVAPLANVPRRVGRALGALSLFQKMNVALAALGLAMLVGFGAQEWQLRKRFQDDFRVQLAAPPVLARGVAQTISATTTGPNGKPRRIPLRFCFNDAKTGRFLLAHTESGDASGIANFDVPDVSDFPERVRLTISAGERDAETVETIETIFPVVGKRSVERDSPPDDAATPKAAFKAKTRAAAPPVVREETNGASALGFAAPAPAPISRSIPAPAFAAADSVRLFSNAVVGDDFVKNEESAVESAAANAETAVESTDAAESALETADAASNEAAAADLPERSFSTRFFPEGGRLFADFENRVWFSCVDSTGAPVAARFELRATAASDAANDAETDVAPSRSIVLTTATSENGVGSFLLTPKLGESYSLAISAPETSQDATRDSEEAPTPGDASASQSARADVAPTFALPDAERGRVAFFADAKVVAPGRALTLDVAASEKVPLAATVDKNGVVVAQRVWTENAGRRRVALTLPNDVSGALTVSLYLGERTPLEKIGETTFYRRAANVSALDATISPDFDGAKTLTVRAPAAENGDANADSNVRLDVFWAPTRADALARLSVDERLGAESDSALEETLGTTDFEANSPAPPPIVFDNLIGMKKRVLTKLTDFWRVEARVASNVVRFGFFGCVVLSTAAIFLVVFRALSLWRGAFVVGCCCAMATFFHFERKTIDFSSALSKSIAFSVAEEERESGVRQDSKREKAREDAATRAGRAPSRAPNPAFAEAFRASWTNVDARADDPAPDVSAARRAATRQIAFGETVDVPLAAALSAEETRSGVLLVKIDANAGSWALLDLAPETDGAP